MVEQELGVKVDKKVTRCKVGETGGDGKRMTFIGRNCKQLLENYESLLEIVYPENGNVESLSIWSSFKAFWEVECPFLR